MICLGYHSEHNDAHHATKQRVMLLSGSRTVPDSKVHGANMGAIWGRQDPGGPHVGPMNIAIWGGRYECQGGIFQLPLIHYNDVIMSIVASQITGVSIVCSTVVSGADQRKHQSSTSLAFMWGIHRWPVNSLHKGPVTWKMFPFDDVIMFKQG